MKTQHNICKFENTLKVQSQILTQTTGRKVNGRNDFYYKQLKYKNIYQEYKISLEIRLEGCKQSAKS